MKIAYITDSGCSFSKKEMAEVGIFSLPLQISVDGTNYNDLEELSVQDAIEYLKVDKTMTTSLPSLGLIDDLFKELKEKGYEKVYAVPICSGLSGTMNALQMTAAQYDLPIVCVDTYVTAYVERYCIELIKNTLENGKSEEEALLKVAEVIDSCDTLLVPKDLNHLAKSGRMTPLALRLANLFNIKPILRISKLTNGKIDVIEKVRTFKKALANALSVMKEEIKGDDYIIYVVHVGNEEDLAYFAEIVKENFPNNEIITAPLCSPVGIHTGLGCIAIQYYKKVK